MRQGETTVSFVQTTSQRVEARYADVFKANQTKTRLGGFNVLLTEKEWKNLGNQMWFASWEDEPYSG